MREPDLTVSLESNADPRNQVIIYSGGQEHARTSVSAAELFDQGGAKSSYLECVHNLRAPFSSALEIHFYALIGWSS